MRSNEKATVKRETKQVQMAMVAVVGSAREREEDDDSIIVFYLISASFNMMMVSIVPDFKILVFSFLFYLYIYFLTPVCARDMSDVSQQCLGLPGI